MKSVPHHTEVNSFIYKGNVFNGTPAITDLCTAFRSSGDECLSDLADFLLCWLDGSDYIVLQTSGSTGRPKQIKVSKKAMLVSAQKTLHFFNLQHGDKALLCLSPKYIAGKMMVLRSMLGRLNLLYYGLSSNPLRNLNESIDFVAMVPAQAQEVYLETKAKFDLITQLIIGGAAVGQELKSNLATLQTKCWETYGMTETVSHIALRTISDEGNNGFNPLPGVDISINEDRCLLIDAPDLLEKPLVTNDLVDISDDGQFHLLGRIDNVINTGGVKVVSEQIENTLSAFIKERIAVVGLPDIKWGQRVVLVIEGDHYEFDESIFDDLKKYEKPKEIIFLKSFPISATGKIKRSEIKELLSQ
ncbi:AMP-binding protein [Carboxylicivirga sp. N1Y90]|uniref:AMP-binding protein n=1 Tax=Carboxylicivirga fragile TaxID=3417571 RepID=UPI003D341229|nr:AMP-binding protein [Marinilabiliaceae bacterium N1Y90]